LEGLFINSTSVVSTLQHRDINHGCEQKLGSVASPNVLTMFFCPVERALVYFLGDKGWMLHSNKSKIQSITMYQNT